jgi:hypothetical protein
MTGNGLVFILYEYDFQPGVVLLGFVQDDVPSFNVSLRSITLGEIDQTRALRAKDVHSEAQSLRLGIIVHDEINPRLYSHDR